jgi:hypothetical protein
MRNDRRFEYRATACACYQRSAASARALNVAGRLESKLSAHRLLSYSEMREAECREWSRAGMSRAASAMQQRQPAANP